MPIEPHRSYQVEIKFTGTDWTGGGEGGKTGRLGERLWALDNEKLRQSGGDFKGRRLTVTYDRNPGTST